MMEERLKGGFILAGPFALLCFLVAPGECLAQPADAHFRRALSLQFEGAADAAIAEYQRGLAINPYAAEAHARLGTLYLEEKGDVERAISELITSCALDPSCKFCAMRLQEALDRQMSRSQDQVQRGNQLYSSGQLNRAIAAYRTAVYLDSKNPDAHNSLAWSLYRQGKLDEGLTEVREALRLKPNDPEYINTEACLLFDQGDVRKAMELWRRAIANSKTPSPADLYGLALGYFALGNRQDAIRSYKEAIQIDPQYADVRYVRDRIGMSVRAIAVHDQLVTLSQEKAR